MYICMPAVHSHTFYYDIGTEPVLVEDLNIVDKATGTFKVSQIDSMYIFMYTGCIPFI